MGDDQARRHPVSVLAADPTLSPAGETATLLALTGVCPLPGPAGAGLDPALVHRVATAAIGSFLARLACAVMHPAGTAVPAGVAGPDSPAYGGRCDDALLHPLGAPRRPQPAMVLSGSCPVVGVVMLSGPWRRLLAVMIQIWAKPAGQMP